MSGSAPVAIASDQSPLPASQSGTWSVAILSGSATIGRVIPAINASGGATVATPFISAATTNPTLAVAGQHTLYGYTFSNTNATAWRFVKFYNLAVAPTVVTSTVYIIVGIPPNGQVSVPVGAVGINFTTGIAYATTANPALTDTTAVAAGEVVGTLFYG